MGFWDTVKRVGLGAATGGLSEVYRYGKDKIGKLDDESASAQQQRADLNQQGQAAGAFAGLGEQGFQQLGAEAQQSRDFLRRLASGEESLSKEQLRQGLQQNVAAQRSMAASALPQNAAMAARTAANNMGRLGAGMSGQAAMAGIAERQAAQQALAQMIMQQRQQDLQAAINSRGNAINAFGGITPEKSWLDKWGGAIASGAALATK